MKMMLYSYLIMHLFHGKMYLFIEILKCLKAFYPKSGFVNGYTFQGATRMSVKLDFMVGLLSKALKATGNDTFRGVQVLLGEVVGWRNLFWSMTNAMAGAPDKWSGDAVLTKLSSCFCVSYFFY